MRPNAVAMLLAAAMLAAPPAMAENPMGYRLLSADEAAALPRNGGALGLDVERAERITDRGLTFDIMRVKQAKRGSTGAAAGLAAGDEIIAVDGRVFASIAAFAAYVGAAAPGRELAVDYIPSGGGPQQAQRVSVRVGDASHATSGGMSTGKKVAIGAGAAALLGCYALGCFSKRQNPAGATPQ